MLAINNEGRDIYFGNPPFMNKIINADSAIIAEYIKFILRIKEKIITDIKNKINYLKETSGELNKLLDDKNRLFLRTNIILQIMYCA
jgi:hypothetical protein